MNRSITETRNVTLQPYLNIGCGRRYHSDWVNLDLDSDDPEILQHDVTRGVPFEPCQFEAVYHSHVLEHLKPKQGENLIHECFRVLKPGGILRIVVPDLERIVKLYLETHQRAWAGDKKSEVDYNWMKLELLDQMVREKSGGRMGRYMASRKLKNSEFVRSRVGDELSICQSADLHHSRGQTLISRTLNSTFDFRIRMVRRMVRWLLGRVAENALDVGMFRSQGEIHHWMYDRFSLRKLCERVGFEGFRVCQAEDSRIENYASFELDTFNGDIRKPDSIFVECMKPASKVANQVAA